MGLVPLPVWCGAGGAECCVLDGLFFIPRSVCRGGERCERSGVGLPGSAGGASAVVSTAVPDEPFKPPGDNIERND